MAKVVKRGDFIIVIDGWHAKAYDRKTRKKLLEGAPDRVFRELEEKIEGSLAPFLDFDFSKKKRRDKLWDF